MPDADLSAIADELLSAERQLRDDLRAMYVRGDLDWEELERGLRFLKAIARDVAEEVAS